MKTWQKVALVSSLGVASIAYYKRERVRSGYRYVKDKFADLMATFADEWIGVKEIGNNKAFGDAVFQNMLKNVGWSSYDEWCMYFAKAVHYEVYKDDRQTINKVLSGSTQRSFDKVKNDPAGIYEAIETGGPKKGDIAIWRRTNDQSRGHAGVVVKVNDDGTMETIEGNTGDRSISDGDTVARKVRPSTIGKNIPGSTLRLRGFIRRKFLNETEKRNLALVGAGLIMASVGGYAYYRKFIRK